MIKGGKGGTKTKTGQKFEKKTELKSSLQNQGVDLTYFTFTPKGDFLQYMRVQGIEMKDYWSKRMYPDEAVFYRDTLYIIEKKFQSTAGSTDEKLQTCDFKRKQYQKIVKSLGLKVQYAYLLNNWFKKDEYKDVLAYIKEMGCSYFFNTIPASFFE